MTFDRKADGRGPFRAIAGRAGIWLVSCPSVTNWRQIQARIRKARIGADAPAKLLSLYEKTHDAMVAFELARAYEKDSRAAEAIEWYTKSFEKFRRDDWKKKAAEAITRLGGTPPVSLPALDASPGVPAPSGEAGEQPPPSASLEAAVSTVRPFGSGLPSQLFHSPAADDSAESLHLGDSEADAEPAGVEAGGTPPTMSAAAAPGTDGAVPGRKRRRRGRRGGRGRHKSLPGTPGQAPTAATPQISRPAQVERPPREERPQAPEARPVAPPSPPQASEETGWVGPKTEALRARAGDPALASQIAQLEMQLRRLIACPPHALDDAELAPAGPGVLILSDSDLTTNYYVVACATLRIEMGRLGRSDRGARGRDAGPSLRSRLAEHLEISESQVTRYLNQHCVARWLQLDDGAPRLAHFAIAVLHPPLND
jgi:hypothetical protein